MEVKQWFVEIELSTLEEINLTLIDLWTSPDFDNELEKKFDELDGIRENYIKELTEFEEWMNWLSESDKWIEEAYKKGLFNLDYEIKEFRYNRKFVKLYLTIDNEEQVNDFQKLIAEHYNIDLKNIQEDDYQIEKAIYDIFEAISKAIEKFDRNYLYLFGLDNL